MMDDLAKVGNSIGSWDNFVVTLDTHPLGALIFLLLVVAVCYAVVKRKG